MKITLKKIFLKDIQKVVEPQKSQVKIFLEELFQVINFSMPKLEGFQNLQGLLHIVRTVISI